MAKKHTENSIIQIYIAENAQGPIKGKGRRIFNAKTYKLSNFDINKGVATYQVSNEQAFRKDHIVTIHSFLDSSSITSQCSCPYSWVGICKHQVAALLDLEEQLSDVPNLVQEPSFDSSHTEIKMKSINEQVIRANLASECWPPARQLAFNERAKVLSESHHTVKASVTFKEYTHEVTIRKNGKDVFETACDCEETRNKLCIHKAIVLLQMKFTKGANAFDLIQDWEAHKNKLLEQYGFSLADDLEGKFYFKEGKMGPELVVLDENLIKIGELERLGVKYQQRKEPIRTFNVPSNNKRRRSRSSTGKPKKVVRYGLGYAFNFWKEEMLPSFEVVPIVGKLDEEGNEMVSHVSALLTHYGAINSQHIPPIQDEDLDVFDLVQSLSWRKVAEFAREHTEAKVAYTWNYGGGHYVNRKQLEDTPAKLIYDYIGLQLSQMLSLLKDKRVYQVIKPTKAVTINNIAPISVSDERAKLHFTLIESGDFYRLMAAIQLSDELIPIKEAKLMGGQMIINNQQLYLTAYTDDGDVWKTFIKNPTVKVRKRELSRLLQSFILPLRHKYFFDIKVEINIVERQILPKAEIYLKESDNYLVIQPLVSYAGRKVELNGLNEIVYEEGGEIVKVARDKVFEEDFNQFLLRQHPSFEEEVERTSGLYYYMDYEDLMKEMWFLAFYEQLRALYVEVYGFKDLKKFKYNINKPQLQMRVSSGIDWFDIKAEIVFGSQVVSLKEVQKALLRNEQFVKLGDGTLGMIPDDWVKRYGSLFKMGKVKGDSLQVAKLHFSLIEELYDQIDDYNILEELRDKKHKLREFSEIESIPVPSSIQATLRNYQVSGFNWFHFLDEFNWGGCLADDMGLGKTLQVLTFLQYQKNKLGDVSNLVVVPTSLIFVWQEETAKFCPDLTVYLHHGPTRIRHQVDVFKGHDIILTTYGIVTSDADLFSQFEFNYVVLDESQAIKNPSTKRYKAVRLLKCRNRLALTGTPIENNTFDLYAQMNFLNPGLLGSIDFFKQEYANPIDKQGDELKVHELKKIVYPFILRRTKELVAKELPAKTESVLYCHMKEEQRGVYDAFKNEYRYKILERIDQEGMSKAGMFILEGLMKLRQICDSPALLNNVEDYGKESVKLDELHVSITEKTNQHKILIFSQFLGMLGMIRELLEKEGIKYEYLDGSVSPSARQEAVGRFQKDEACRVFLISLRAGGFGLNLTAADYVFLVDPWWNPAVEQQAIDRSHRIGQKRKVFAYKMICKDTIEEKILKLQRKKQALAADLISTEKSFIKKLTRDDVEYLFS